MAGVGEIRPQVPIWPPGEVRPIKPGDGKRQMPRRQPGKDNTDKPDTDEDDHDSSHIDEYV